jgi:hypothetical protein
MAENDLQDLEARARAAYQRESEALQPAVRKRLALARREALIAAAPRGSRLAWGLPVWLPVGATAVLVAALAVVLTQRNQEGNYAELAQTAATVEDMEILLGDEDFELLDNLDFYLWLEEQADAG